MPLEIVRFERSALLDSGSAATLENSDVLFAGQFIGSTPKSPRKHCSSCAQDGLLPATLVSCVTSVTFIITNEPARFSGSVAVQRLPAQPVMFPDESVLT